MAKNKILAKITMLSAGSAAPYDSAVVGLTTWDQDLVVGGVTYLKGRIITLANSSASSGDASRGQGGYASPLELSLTIADRCAAGRLWPLVEAGAVPLVGAEVRILNESGGVAPQTWYLHEPKLDGASIKFTLKTMRYLCTKPVSWSATRYDGAATVGLAVGDASVRGINAAGHYKGVSVPTKAFATWEPLQYPGIAVSGNRGNPSAWGAMEYGNTTHPYDYVGPAPFGQFCFVFPSQALRDAFMNQYCGGLGGSQSGGHVAPNACLLVSDGSNSEIILTSDSTGASSGSATVLECSSRVIGGATYYTILLIVTQNGMLASSAASSIQLYFLQQDNPICAGASSVVGFQSKASNASEYGITSPASIQATKNGIIYLMPTEQVVDGFISWTELKNAIGFAIDPVSYVASGKTDSWSGSVEAIKTAVSDAVSGGAGGLAFSTSWSTSFDNNGHGTVALVMKLVNLLRSTSFNYQIDQIAVDSLFDFSANIAQSGGSFNETTATWIDPFASVAKTSPSQSVSDTRGLAGKTKISGHVFDSLESLSSDTSCNFSVYVSVSVGYSTVNVTVTISERIYKIVLYAITKLAFGSNPAVVVPGDFPGTFNPTTTPAMAIDQLAAWAGLSIIKTGGWTPPAGVWGRYLGPDPSSSDSMDPLTVTQAIDKLAAEAWTWVAEGSGPAVAPSIESMTAPVLDTSSIDDVVTLPQIAYCYAGTSSQYKAEILNVDETFDVSKGDGYYWGGWQEKDACHLSASPGSAVLAMCQLEDCLAVVCVDGYLRCSYDGGTTWPYSLNLGDTSDGMVMAGNGIMLAFAYSSGNVVVARSIDAGRTWSTSSPAALASATVPSGWYDSMSKRFWLCGSLVSDGSLWYSADGTAWTHVSVESIIEGRVDRVVALGNSLVASALTTDGSWGVWISTDLGTTWSQPSAIPQTSTSRPALSMWGGKFRVSIGSSIYSSIDLSTWTNSATPIALSSFATDGKVVSALGSEAAGGNHVYYSRDQGATWKSVRVSPEGVTWVHIAVTISVWDDNAKCFRFSAWGPTRIIALGDLSVLDIWHRCRVSYLKTQTLHAETYDWAGVYDADVVVSMLLDAKDGIDTEYEQARIDWMAKQARFATLKVEFADVVEQLSLTAFQKIAIPRQRLEDSLLAGNVPTYGLLTKVEPDPMTGISTIEIIMPPL